MQGLIFSFSTLKPRPCKFLTLWQIFQLQRTNGHAPEVHEVLMARKHHGHLEHRATTGGKAANAWSLAGF